MESWFHQLNPPKVGPEVRQIDFEECKLELVGRSRTKVV